MKLHKFELELKNVNTHSSREEGGGDIKPPVLTSFSKNKEKHKGYPPVMDCLAFRLFTDNLFTYLITYLIYYRL